VDLMVLVLIYYVSPWLRWNGEPGVRFDLAHRQFTIFWTTFYPEDFVLLAWGLLIAALTLFTITVAAGRIFCGWACPQTIWTLVYFSIERFIEGDRTERMRRDRGSFSLEWLTKKALKFTAWGVVAFSISITFVGYFTEIRELLPRIAHFELSGWERFFVLAPAAGSFFFSAVLREQVCFHMCPYARFQSVMLDRDSMIISYDRDRGEPRGHRRRNADSGKEALGSCIDCRKCVHVCPTGIDIRDGLQYQCIGCAACVDACSEIMDQMGYGDSLVRYSSENRDEGKVRHWLRPRLVGYSSLIVVLIGLISVFIANRIPLDVDVIRDRNRLYRESWDGSIENVYSLRISNRESEQRRYTIGLEGDSTLEVQGPRSVEIAPGQMLLVPVSLRLDPSSSGLEAPLSVEFVVRAEHDPGVVVRAESPFHRPHSRPRSGVDG
jgi:cytochrome c oxidase accessory protein FixG